MRKTKASAVLVVAIVCFVFWLLITGQITALIAGRPSIQILAAGCIVSILVALFTARFFVHENAWYLLRPDRFFKLLFYCIVIFPVELIKANVDVAGRALSPRLPVNPGIVKVPSELKSEYGKSMLANSITLTPGTITMDVAEEDGKTNLYIHWINVTSTDHEKAGEAIKGTLEKWVRRIWP